MATDENNHKNEARDDWTGCTFRVERGPSSEGRAWGMADILTDVRRRVWPARPGFSPRRPARDRARPRRRLTPPAQAFAGHAEATWSVVASRGRRLRRGKAPGRPAEQERAAQRVAVARVRARARARPKNRFARDAVDRAPARSSGRRASKATSRGVRSRRSHDRLRK